MPITRRDFLNGSALAITGISTGLLTACKPSENTKTALSTPTASASIATTKPSTDYPPSLTKLRGNHEGSFDVAHELAWRGKKFDVANEDSIGDYDLVVVGAGISGLASAYWYRQQFADSKILILDNHDDFGGHAKRNEFSANVDGKEIFRLSFGGTESIDSPKTHYSKESLNLLTALGIDVDKFNTFYHQDLFDGLGLQKGVFYTKTAFGQSKVIAGELSGEMSEEEAKAIFADAPLSDEDKQALITLCSNPKDYLADIPKNKRETFATKTSYVVFLKDYAKLSPTAIMVLQEICLEYYGYAGDYLSLADAFAEGYPGTANLSLESDEEEVEPYIYHFPDGNASIARLLVKNLIPNVVSNPEHSKNMSVMEAIVLDKFDYSQLDKPNQPVNIRLNSTVVQVKNLDKTAVQDSQNVLHNVMVGYQTGDKVYRINAKHAILACNGHMMPYIASDFPEQQKKDFAQNVKMPLIYGKVLVKNWQAFKKLGVWQMYAPQSPFCLVMLDYPVSMGGYEYPKNPDEPMVIHMVRCPVAQNTGKSLRDALKQGRAELYGQSYEAIEKQMLDMLREIYEQAGESLNDKVLAITVNRWGHGYSYEYNSLSDTPNEAERIIHSVQQPMGAIHIANSDSEWAPYTQGAIDQAWRAVSEIVRGSA